MVSFFRVRFVRLLALLSAIVSAGLLVGACGSSGMSGMDHDSGHKEMSTMDTTSGDGLAAQSSGFRFAPTTSSLPAGQPGSLQFHIIGADGKPVTTFESDQTKLMHFYLIRSDLTGFQHVHPSMGPDGTWTAPLEANQPGSYRAYTSFISKNSKGKPIALVLSQQITVPGTATTTPLPAASPTTQVDGYTLTLDSDHLTAKKKHELTITVSKDGHPVTDLQPYLDTYAHLTAFRENDLAFAHLHPHGTATNDHGGPTLTFEVNLPRPGNWRLFAQFQTNDTLHTAAITITVH